MNSTESETTVQTAPPAQSRTTQSDLARSLPGWLRGARGLADSHHLEAVATALDSLAAQRGRPAFRVAVVGEFNRGKSTLINTLIARKLLPTGQLPGLPTEIAVRGVEQAEALRLTWPDGHRHVCGLDQPEVWRELLDGRSAIGAPTGATEESLSPPPSVVAEVAGTWLTGLDLELVDTPGANNGGPRGFKQLRRSLSAADGALFVISAISPLGTTERQLLEEELLCRHLPHIAVVVTMLNRVDAEDRDGVITGLRERLAALPGRGELPILVAPDPDERGPRLVELRSLIGGWAAQAGRGQWRDRRIAANTADYCDTMTRLAAGAIAAARLSETEQQERAARTEADRAEEEQVWEELRIDIGSRQLESTRHVRDLLHAERGGILESLRNELEAARDPHAWWQRDLPVRIRWHLSVTAKSIERAVLARLAADAEWLDAEVRRRLPEAAPSPMPRVLRLEATAEHDAIASVSDLGKLRIAARVGAQGGAALGYLIAAARHSRLPMIYSIGFSVVSGLIAEAAIRSATEAQRQQIDSLLVQTVDESIGVFAVAVTDTVVDRYREGANHLRDSHHAWSQSYADILGAAVGPEDTVDWQALAVAASTLAARIRAELSRSVSDLSERGN